MKGSLKMAAVWCLPFVLSAASCLASDIDTRTEIENLRRRLEILERRLAEEEAAKEEAGQLSVEAAGKRLGFWGALEFEAAYLSPEDGDDESDLSLATAELGFDVAVGEQAGGHIVVLYEEGEDIEIDEANVVLTFEDVAGGTLQVIGGKVYVPFGRFQSAMISDPLTLELGETNQTAALIGWGNDLFQLQAGVFSGGMSSGDDVEIDTVVASMECTPAGGLALGASFLSDVATTDYDLTAFDASVFPNVAHEDVAAASLFVSLAYGNVTADAEYVFALHRFSTALTAAAPALTGREPAAWHVEAGYTPAERWGLAARYEQARDFEDDVRRYGATVSYGLFDHTLLAVEYVFSEADPGGDDTAHAVTGQVAVEF